MCAEVDRPTPVAPFTHEPPLPSRITDFGFTGGPSPMSFRNVVDSEYEYWVPVVSAVSVTVTLIDEGVPQQFETGEHATWSEDGLYPGEPVFVREGGSIGAVISMEKVLAAPVMFLGLSLPEHGYHAPNENFDWQQASWGMVAFVKYFDNVARM